MCFPCFKNSSTDLVTPDMETRRMQQAEAAERRMRQQEGRGIKDPEKFKFQQLRKQELERRQEEAEKQNIGGGGLKHCSIGDTLSSSSAANWQFEDAVLKKHRMANGPVIFTPLLPAISCFHHS
ncbi:hypothetical protein L9F63_018063, partial [Diploptera punctata]